MNEPNKAVDYILKHSAEYAKAKSKRVYLEEFRKTKKALLMKDALAQASAAPKTKNLIDVHRHFAVAAVSQAAEAATGAGGGAGTNTRSIEALLDDMDKGGVKIGVLSTGTEAPFKNPATKVATCRKLNEDMAKARSDHPGRFGIFANLPVPDIDATLKEIEYAFDTLKVDGVHMFSNIGGKWFGDVSLGPIYAELNRRKAVVYVHPTAPNCCGNLPILKDGVPNEGAMIEYGTDTTRTIASAKDRFGVPNTLHTSATPSSGSDTWTLRTR
mgnify:CR=1 FL=1